MNSFFFFFCPLHICIGEGEHSPVAVPLGIDMSQIVNCATQPNSRQMCGPGGPVISFLYQEELNVPDGWMDRTSHICALQARAEAADGVIPQQKC